MAGCCYEGRELMIGVFAPKSPKGDFSFSAYIYLLLNFHLQNSTDQSMSTSMHYGAPMEIFQIAERLRRDMTATEKMIWEKVSNKQLGVRIRRQHPIWKFIADFYCHEVRLVIEIDGRIHLLSKNKEYDISRGITLKEFQIEILRFTNDEVIKETSLVIEKIKSTIEKLKQKGIHKSNRRIIDG